MSLSSSLNIIAFALTKEIKVIYFFDISHFVLSLTFSAEHERRQPHLRLSVNTRKNLALHPRLTLKSGFKVITKSIF